MYYSDIKSSTFVLWREQLPHSFVPFPFSSKMNAPEHDKSYKMTSVPSENLDQNPNSFIRVYALHSSIVQKVSSSRQLRLWSDLADAQADLSLRLVHRSFCLFWCAPVSISFSTMDYVSFLKLQLYFVPFPFDSKINGVRKSSPRRWDIFVLDSLNF